MRNERHTKYDIIGDIHGQHAKLVGLLRHLGYEFESGAVAGHPEGRKVLFLGDFIDRGPAIREVLHLVPGMVDSGTALAVMGNHEFNAVEILLEGPEMRLPEGVSFKDNDSTVRSKARVRWWGHDGSMDTTVGAIAMPPGSIKCAPVSHSYVATNVPNYPATAPPVFVGHSRAASGFSG